MLRIKKCCSVSLFILILTSCTNNSDMLSHNSAITPPPPSLNTSRPTPTMSLTKEPTPKPIIAPKPIQRQSSPALNKRNLFSLTPFIKIAQIESGKGLRELSGQTPTDRRGEFWGINDKGNNPEVFRFSVSGSVLQLVKVKKVDNDDWEAITRIDDGSLLIGGTGDNKYKKKTYSLHLIQTPSRGDETIPVVKSYEFDYSDRHSHNCEAIFVFNGNVYLISKILNKNLHSKFYRLDNLDTNKVMTAIEVAELSEIGIVTDAAYDQDRNILAILTYGRILLFHVVKESDLQKPPMFQMPIKLKQCEGVCFYGEELIVTNEEGELWAAKIEQQ